MCGKVFLLTTVVVCVSFVQVQGEEATNEKIEEAVNEVKKLLHKPYWETTYFDSYVRNLDRLNDRRIPEYLAKAQKQYFDFQNFLYNMANFVKSETFDQTTYPCVDNVREMFSRKAKNITMKLRSSLQAELLLFRHSKFRDEANALERTADYEYNQSPRRIRNCTTVDEVNYAVRYYDYFYTAIMTSLQKTDGEFSSFVKSVDVKIHQHLREYNTNFAPLKTDSVDEMRKCIYPKAAISGNLNLLQLKAAK